MYSKKLNHRDELVPLFRELTRRAQPQRMKDIAAEAGLTDWQTGRLLSFAISSPSFLDMLRLLRALEMPLEEAADIVGVGSYHAPTSRYDKQVLSTLHAPDLTDEQRLLLAQNMRSMATIFRRGNQGLKNQQPDPVGESLLAAIGH